MWNNQGGFDGYGDQGGGYMDTTTQGFNSPQMSQDKKFSRSSRAQSLVPVTVAQIFAAEQVGDKFVIDNMEMHQVTFIGFVRAVKDSATRLDYEIDDMTSASIEVKQFVDNDENTPPGEQTLPMRENTYVRVFGNVRSFNNKRNLVAFKITPVLDMNELTAHILEVIHTHLALSKGTTVAGGETSMQTSTYQKDTNTTTGGSTNYGDSNMVANTGLNSIQQQVAMIIKGCHDEQGISIQEITGKLRGLSQKAIQDAIEFLSNEGHIYSTIDDEHFKSTDS